MELDPGPKAALTLVDRDGYQRHRFGFGPPGPGLDRILYVLIGQAGADGAPKGGQAGGIDIVGSAALVVAAETIMEGTEHIQRAK